MNSLLGYHAQTWFDASQTRVPVDCVDELCLFTTRALSSNSEIFDPTTPPGIINIILLIIVITLCAAVFIALFVWLHIRYVRRQPPRHIEAQDMELVLRAHSPTALKRQEAGRRVSSYSSQSGGPTQLGHQDDLELWETVACEPTKGGPEESQLASPSRRTSRISRKPVPSYISSAEHVEPMPALPLEV